MLQSCRGPSDAGPTWMVGADHSVSSPHTEKKTQNQKKNSCGQDPPNLSGKLNTAFGKVR